MRNTSVNHQFSASIGAINNKSLTRHSAISYIAAAAGLILAMTGISIAQTPATQAGSRGIRPIFQIPKHPIDPKLPTLWIIGDSTVRNGTKDDGGNGQWGWGNPIYHYFDAKKVNIQNRAVGGTSSRSFMTSQWPWIMEEIKPGDYVIMQFGHNDGGNVARDTRFRASISGNGEETLEANNTQSGKTETVHTYGWYLRKYIADAKSKGAVMAIVCSPIPRNRGWEDGRIEKIPPDKFSVVAQEAAKQADAQFIDLNARVIKKFTALGQQKVTDIYFPEGEQVHPDWAGAVLIAETVIEGMKDLKIPLIQYLLPEAPKDLKNPSGRAR